MTPKCRTAAAVAALAFALPACGADEEPGAARERPIVVATTTQLGDIVRQVAGDAADVHQILQANTDPHEYEPRPDDIRAVAGAALIVASGSGLDSWIEDMVGAAGGDPAELELAPAHTPHQLAGEHEGEGEEHGHEGSAFDPHWWHDPRNVESAVAAIRDALSRVAPANAAVYRRNADGYLAQVRALDARIQACMDRVPAAERKLVTSHDAFGYFARRYGITVVGALIPSQSTRAQASAGEVAELAALIRRERVQAIFPESSINPSLAAALARETGAKADAALYGDTLGPAGSDGETYLKMEAANADAMVQGFTGGRERC
jgi:ABC-type Zn uptake system ZnuABC Zn-binding protein ZnuA